MRKVEILAPAGSYESMRAAINAGSDAVYIGGSRFGARAFADNLTEEDLKRAIDFVHLREKKLYLTVNTLLKEEELKEELYKYLLPFYEQGLDAVIVQDIGVMSFIHRNFPKLPIHASTQLSMTGSDAANGLKALGVTRFVPARELSLEEIRKIHETTDLEIETFVHGALCYCYSGQCLLSSMIGGRSGNRGRCAQPCRMQYRLSDGKKGYFMSPKDICTLELIPEIIEAGVSSFKIEGRMKRPEYAAFTAYLYGKYADYYEKLGKEGYYEYLKKQEKELLEDKTALMDLYNRGGFSKGYYTQYHGKSMMSVNRPNHSGVLAAHVVRAGKRNALLCLDTDVNGQDVLEFRSENETAVYEYTLKDGKGKGQELMANILPGSKIYPGMQVFRTKNQKLLTEIGSRFMGKEEPVRIKGVLEAVPEKPLRLTFTCERADGIVVTAVSEGEIVQKAQSQPMTEEKIEKAVKQIQDTGFLLEELSVSLEGAVFFPIGKLKELRRECLFKLAEAIAAPYRRNAEERAEDTKSFSAAGETKKGFLDASVLTKEQTKAVLDTKTDRIYLSYALYKECISDGMDFSGKEIVFTLPYVMREKNRERLISEVREICKQNLGDGFLVRSIDEFFWLLKEKKENQKLILDSNLYVLNKEAEKAYAAFGADETTASVEQTYKELLKAGCDNKSLIVYGHLPLMITAQCMVDTVYGCKKKEGFWKLYDRKDKELLLRNVCKECYNILYDGTPLSLSEEKEAVKSLSPKRLRLNFTIEDKEETEKILHTFFEVFRFDKDEKKLEKTTTKGHFYKGVE